MLRPNEREFDALKGIASAAPGYFAVYVEYQKRCRDHEREAMETSTAENTEILKGKCQMLTEQINNLKSLIPSGGN